MKRLAGVLALAALAACGGSHTVSQPLASSAASDPAAMADQLRETGVLGEHSTEASPRNQPIEDIQPDTDGGDVVVSKTSIRFIELTINQADPKDQKRLVKYLLNLTKYHIVECRQISPTHKFWKFMVVDTPTQNAKPQLDLPIDIGPDD